MRVSLFAHERAQLTWVTTACVVCGVCVCDRLVPFVALVVVAEELIPFVALYLPRLLPSTCVLPAQHARILRHARTRQLEALFAHRPAYRALVSAGESTGFVPLRAVPDPAAVCKLLGLPAWGLSTITRWRVGKHLETIAADDELLRNEDNGRKLSMADLDDALSDRGM